MPKFKVEHRRTFSYQFEVEAATKDDAEAIAVQAHIYNMDYKEEQEADESEEFIVHEVNEQQGE